MRLTKLQLEILHILWAANFPLSIQEIAEKTKFRFAAGFITALVIENLLAKDAVYKAGVFHSYAGEKEVVLIRYSARLRFDEYYADKFKSVSSWNMFNLICALLRADRLSPKQLRELAALLAERTAPFEN